MWIWIAKLETLQIETNMWFKDKINLELRMF